MDFVIDKEKNAKSYEEFMKNHKDLRGVTLGEDCKIKTGTIPVSMIKMDRKSATTKQ